jgi:hypothetical protein
MPSCGYCQSKALSCLVSSDSNSCSNCVRYNRKDCDAKEISEAAFLKIAKERERIRQGILNAELEEERGFEVMRSARARKKRFEKLGSFLDGREGELIRRGVKTIEELEKLEEEERLLKERADASTVATSEPTGANSSSGDWVLSSSLLRDLDTAQWGFVDETVEPNADTS